MRKENLGDNYCNLFYTNIYMKKDIYIVVLTYSYHVWDALLKVTNFD